MYIYSASHLGQPVTASAGQDLLNKSQLARAVAQNRRWGQLLRWRKLYIPISIYYLRFRAGPSENEFAQAVARWQKAVMHATSPNGELDLKTWKVMRPRGEPATFTARGRFGNVKRPRGNFQVMTTFGNPGLPQWEVNYITKIDAPQGCQFTVVVNNKIEKRDYLWAHRLLKDHFEKLFKAIDDNGLWDQIQPVSGPHASRRKRGGSRLSMHAFGIAIDINPKAYPRRQALCYPDLRVVEIFRDHGFHWGIFFLTPDPMHFQFATGA